MQGANVLNVPRGHMPFTAEHITGRHGVVWFHSKMNPYNNWERMQQQLTGRSTHEIKIRAYGWAEQTAGSQFPMFGDHNVFSEHIDEVCPDGTRYMVADPAGARNWFMLWVKVDEQGVVWVYREWPDVSYGEWAVPGNKADGNPGPGQKAGAGRGVDEYSNLIWALETEERGKEREEIEERFIDPRSAGSSSITKEGGITLLDLLAQAQDPMYFTPSAAVSVEERVLIINDLLSFNREEPIEHGKNQIGRAHV